MWRMRAVEFVRAATNRVGLRCARTDRFRRWVGPVDRADLSECGRSRNRNQLPDDYLREVNERFGLVLLVWRGTRPGRQWLIDGKRVGESGLCCALKQHWETISNSFPNVTAVEVVLIDLMTRVLRSSD